MKLTSLVFAAGATAALLVGGTSEARELRFGTGAPENTPWGKALAAFQQKVEEKSDGELTLNVFYGAALGDEQEMTRMLVKGRLDLGSVSATAIALVVPEFNLLSQPYAFDSAEQRYCVEDNHVHEIFGPRLEDAGLVGLSWVEVGHEVLFTKSPVVVPGDLDGVKTRSPATKAAVRYMEATGASVAPSGISDIVPNLKTGAISAASTPIVLGVAFGVPQMAPNITLTRHVGSAGAVVASNRIWSKLSEDERTWLREAALETFPSLRADISKAEVGLLAKSAEAGVQIHELSDDELAAWKAVAEEQREAAVSEAGKEAPELWAALMAAKASCAQ